MRTFLAGLFSILAASAALAADPDIVIDSDVDPARFGWSGVYVGASAGYAWLEDVDNQFVPPLRDEGQDWNFGGHVGYRHGLGNFVVGGEFEATRLDITYETFNFITVENGYTLRALAGYAWDRVLVTGHLGAMYATTNIGLEDWTLALGVGLDYALTDHVTIGAHYTHHTFEGFDGTMIDGTLDVATARFGFKF
jgi:outer membrane immunogenic protein